MKARERGHLLIEGLIGEHIDLYRNNASFYGAVNTLANMLPAMVEGLVSQAEQYEVERKQLLAQLLAAPGPGVTL